MSAAPLPATGEKAVVGTRGPQAEAGGSKIPGFSGPSRVRLPLFALVALGTVLIGIIPFPHGARLEILIALLLFFLLLIAAFVLPWERLPDWAWLVIPIGYIAVIAIIRDAQGPSHSELLVVYLLPIVWMSLYGRRLHLLVGLFCMDLALMVPILLVGAPNYPLSTWRQVVVLVIVTTMVASTISTMVHRDRIYVSDLAQQSLLAKRNADDAHNARERLETLLRAATGSAIMGVDPAGTVTFFSAGSRTDARLQRVRGRRHPLHRRLHRPRPDHRAAADDRCHAQGTRPRLPRDRGRSAVDGPAQERRAAPLRRSGTHPPDARGNGRRRQRCQCGLRRGGDRRHRARAAGGGARTALLGPTRSDPVAHRTEQPPP